VGKLAQDVVYYGCDIATGSCCCGLSERAVILEVGFVEPLIEKCRLDQDFEKRLAYTVL
jgi:hypothetical protein